MTASSRLRRHDDRPRLLPLSLWHLWQRVPADEDLDNDDQAFTEQMWTHYAPRSPGSPSDQRASPTSGHPLASRCRQAARPWDIECGRAKRLCVVLGVVSKPMQRRIGLSPPDRGPPRLPSEVGKRGEIKPVV